MEGGTLSKYYLGIDQSKRSTGCVLLDDTGEMVDFTLICEALADNEMLLRVQWYTFRHWIDAVTDSLVDLKAGLIEGLAFGAVGGSKDFLAGLQWYFRAQFLGEYNFSLGTVPVTMWRSKVLTKEEQRDAKAAGKDGLKWAVFNKLPATVRTQFANYVELHRDEINRAKDAKTKLGSKSKKYLEAMWDLADAYFIAQHCLQLYVGK